MSRSALDETDPNNPMGTDGFEFVEYTAPDPAQLAVLFRQLGFRAAARHRSKNVTLYRQGGVHFILNAEPNSFSQAFARVHGPSICAMALRVRDAARALGRAISLGAERVENPVGPMELHIPAIRGIGGSLIYLVDRYGPKTIYDVDFAPVDESAEHGNDCGLLEIDHLTHNVHQGRLNEWATFYERLFGFREQHFFEIEGKQTGLRSRAMVSPCGKIRIPINESADDRSQIVEYLNAYRGEGIQHVAMRTNDIEASIDAIARRGIRFLATPATYYEAIDARLPGHGLDVARLAKRSILVDGTTGGTPRILLQIFTENVIGPIFFEVIERRGDSGFGEGNFKALFVAMEEDQVRRGVLKGG
jgi:4-hydroxyphenylpyruvate dioxygenase